MHIIQRILSSEDKTSWLIYDKKRKISISRSKEDSNSSSLNKKIFYPLASKSGSPSLTNRSFSLAPKFKKASTAQAERTCSKPDKLY